MMTDPIAMVERTRKAYFISNGTAITVETLGHSLLAQFPDLRFKTKTIPFVDTVEKARAVSEEIDRDLSEDNSLPIVISTMANPELKTIIGQCKALILDPFSDFLPRLEKTLGTSSSHQTGHRVANQSLYESRIDAIDFSLIHDDGCKTRNYNESDIILIGVSRTGKTPSCLYLALQFGLKAANYPITEEDMESDRLPEPIRAFKGRLYGLTTDANRLVNIRQERRPNSRYASLEQCRFELGAAEEMYYKHNIKFLNTTTISVEEIAARIVEDTGLHRMEQTS
ncbi:MAG: regulator of PEP synthase PpsR (kinase-PPPase family) [Gammaproteobacteria bacterium]|jgi:regulator of PEP synthase PpsR (kinase-PPPase family)